jgi:hypothetical protein
LHAYKGVRVPEFRYLEAMMCRDASHHDTETVFIPLAPDQDDAPATLVDPLPGYGGSWARESDRHARPARYLRVA